MGAYDINGNTVNALYSLLSSLNSAYNIPGEVIWTSTPPHAVTNNYTASMLFDLPDIAPGTQGIACDSISQQIAQIYGGKIITIDVSNGEYVQRASNTDLGHGSTAQFEPEKRDESDLYPPLWVSFQNTQIINDIPYSQYREVFVGQSSSVINRCFYVPLESSDGFSLFAFDFVNRRAYEVYFSAYYSDVGNSRIRVFDMDDATSFSGPQFIPVGGNWLLGDPLDSYVIDFVPRCQAITFFDGLVGCLSDNGYVRFIDVETKSEYLTLSNLIVPFEREGIGFILNPDTNKYDMILSARGVDFNRYYRYQFN